MQIYKLAAGSLNRGSSPGVMTLEFMRPFHSPEAVAKLSLEHGYPLAKAFGSGLRLPAEPAAAGTARDFV